MKVAWSYVALGNIIEANKFIAQDDPDTARKVINEIYEKGNRIKEHPEMGRIVPEIDRSNIKEVFCHQYRIIYKIEPKRIFILTVRHMKQITTEKDI